MIDVTSRPDVCGVPPSQEVSWPGGFLSRRAGTGSKFGPGALPEL